MTALRDSSATPQNDSDRVGLPLGNLTSQIFANVYLNVFDQWIKHCLKAEYYIRYADDFVILAPDKELLISV
ncbi:MAG: RNA-directed DNA polymerase [Patescibacteria group bacterium]